MAEKRKYPACGNLGLRVVRNLRGHDFVPAVMVEELLGKAGTLYATLIDGKYSDWSLDIPIDPTTKQQYPPELIRVGFIVGPYKIPEQAIQRPPQEPQAGDQLELVEAEPDAQS